MKIEKATKPSPGIHNIICDAWWIVEDECILFFLKNYGAPQCNANKEVEESIRDRIHPGKKVVQLDAVFIPVDPRDYCCGQ